MKNLHTNYGMSRVCQLPRHISDVPLSVVVNGFKIGLLFTIPLIVNPTFSPWGIDYNKTRLPSVVLKMLSFLLGIVHYIKVVRK